VATDTVVTLTITGQGWSVLHFWESDVIADPDAITDRIIEALDTLRKTNSV
jgi:very-short-patch-repair endonuclease